MEKLTKKLVITGKITLLTGLHIGGTNAAMNIGGPDKFVIRNPINNKPYIPGSSLKGKLRALLELMDGTIDPGRVNGPTKDPGTRAGKLFGTVGDLQQPSRLIVRDACLSENQEVDFSNTDLPYTETKTEVAIDRITARANPRTFERVPAGAIFDLNMVLNVFGNSEEEGLKASLLQAIKLLNDDYLGGHGSRGYGQVEITDLKFEEKDAKYYEKN